MGRGHARATNRKKRPQVENRHGHELIENVDSNQPRFPTCESHRDRGRCLKRGWRAGLEPQALSRHWWNDMGPGGFQEFRLVYLAHRGQRSSEKRRAKIDYVRIAELSRGAFLGLAGRQDNERKVNFGPWPPSGEPGVLAGHNGLEFILRHACVVLVPWWCDLSGRHRAPRRVGGNSASRQGTRRPSLYDLPHPVSRSMFEEGPISVAMVYLLQKYFGSRGREEGRPTHLGLRRRSVTPMRPIA